MLLTIPKKQVVVPPPAELVSDFAELIDNVGKLTEESEPTGDDSRANAVALFGRMVHGSANADRHCSRGDPPADDAVLSVVAGMSALSRKG